MSAFGWTACSVPDTPMGHCMDRPGAMLRAPEAKADGPFDPRLGRLRVATSTDIRVLRWVPFEHVCPRPYRG